LLLLLLMLLLGAAQVDRAVLMSGVRVIDRPGVLYFVDGRRVVEVHADDRTRAVISAVASGASDEGSDMTAVTDAAALLERLGVVAPSPAQDRSAVEACAADFVAASLRGWVGSDDAAARLQDTTVHLLGDCGALHAALVASGVRCRALPDAAAVSALDPQRDLVTAVAPHDRPASALAEVNEVCVRRGVTWLPIGGYDGRVSHVGPLIIPQETGCFDCLLRRLAANVEYGHVYRDVVADAALAPAPDALRAWSDAIAVLLLLRWIAGRDPRVPGELYTLAVDDLAIRQARVYRVPGCTTCAAPDFVAAAAPWTVARDH
jgi:bacteriocin biosynthesis cyclodehydratase domain-containing protein